MPELLIIEIFFSVILFILTTISIVQSIRYRQDPLTKSKISTQCPCCNSKNITFQSIQINDGKPFSIFPMLNFIFYYAFAIINIFYALDKGEKIKRAFFQAMSGAEIVDNVKPTVEYIANVYVLGYMTKILLIAGTVFLVICMLMPNDTEYQLTKICMNCGTVSDANSDPETPRIEKKEEEPQWASPTKKNH